MKKSSSSLVAITYLSVGIAAFAIQDLILKLASADYPIHQALVIRGLAAILVGALIIVHPGEGEFEWALMLPLLSALANAGSVIFVRKMEGNDLSEVIAFQGTTWRSAMGLLLALTLGFGELEWAVRQHPSMDFLLKGWQWPDLFSFCALLICGVVGATATLFLTKGYSASSASRLAPFEYAAFLWSIILGWLFWGHLLNGKEWLGMGMLVVAGLVSIYAADKTQTEPSEVTT